VTRTPPPEETGTPDPAPEEGRLARARHQAEEAWTRVEVARPDTPVIDAGFETYERDSATGGSLLAGAIAFRLFLVAIPLVLVLYSGLGFLSASEASQPGEIGQAADMSDAMVDAIATVGQTAERGRWVTLAVGLGALVVAVRSLSKSLRIVHLLAWRLPRKPVRNQVVMTLIGVGVIAGVVAVGLVTQWMRSRTPGGGITVSLVIGLGVAAAWLGVQLLLPRADDAPWTALIPGAIVVGVASQGLHAFTVFYLVGRVNRMTSTYGPIGVAMVALLWLFIWGRAIVGAAMLNATLWDRHTRGLRNYAPIDPRLFRFSDRPEADGDPGADTGLNRDPDADPDRAEADDSGRG